MDITTVQWPAPTEEEVKAFQLKWLLLTHPNEATDNLPQPDLIIQGETDD